MASGYRLPDGEVERVMSVVECYLFVGSEPAGLVLGTNSLHAGPWLLASLVLFVENWFWLVAESKASYGLLLWVRMRVM